MAVAKTVWGFIENRDHRVMHRLNNWRAPRWIRFWMLSATRMGDGWLWYTSRSSSSRIWWYAWICGFCGSRLCRDLWDFCFQRAEKAQPSASTLPIPNSLLGDSSSSRPVFLSLRAHHDCLFDCARDQLFLSRAGMAAVLPRRKHWFIARRAGHAFLERCSGRSSARLRDGHRLHCHFRGVRPCLILQLLR